MNVAIFGGSFNPVHNEHIKIAKSFITELNLDVLYVIPTNVAPHKKGDCVESGIDRFNMLKLAFKDVEKVVVSNYELDNGGVSYSYLTIKHFKNLFEESEIYFLMGSDMLDNFPTWKNPQEIAKDCTLTLVEREGDNFDNSKLINSVQRLYNAKVVKLNSIGKNLSSTKIRTSLYLGLDVSNDIPKSVFEYIKSKNLYEGSEYYQYVKTKLPQKRKDHILGVITLSKKLANKLGVDGRKAELSALLHDVAKYEDYKDYKDFKLPKNCTKDIEHQYLGAYICEKVLNVKDEEVLNAVKYHTTGRDNMSTLEKIIYVADIIEPSRRFLGVEELRVAVEKNFESGFITCLNEILSFLKRENKEIYPLTLKAYNYYAKEN